MLRTGGCGPNGGVNPTRLDNPLQSHLTVATQPPFRQRSETASQLSSLIQLENRGDQTRAKIGQRQHAFVVGYMAHR